MSGLCVVMAIVIWDFAVEEPLSVILCDRFWCRIWWGITWFVWTYYVSLIVVCIRVLGFTVFISYVAKCVLINAFVGVVFRPVHGSVLRHFADPFYWRTLKPSFTQMKQLGIYEFFFECLHTSATVSIQPPCPGVKIHKMRWRPGLGLRPCLGGELHRFSDPSWWF